MDIRNDDIRRSDEVESEGRPRQGEWYGLIDGMCQRLGRPAPYVFIVSEEAWEIYAPGWPGTRFKRI
jgi:hypothetical protein